MKKLVRGGGGGPKPPIRLVSSDGQEPPRRPQPPQRDPSLPKRPPCPAYLTPEQRKAFKAICRRLEDAGHLSAAHVASIVALAVAEDDFRQYTQFINEHGETFEVRKQGRPYQCPACKGSAIQPAPKGRNPEQNAECSASVPRSSRTKPCSVCTHKLRVDIEKALDEKVPFRRVSERFGTSTTALFRHAKEHMVAVALDAGSQAGQSCKGCKGTGVIQRPETSATVNYQEVAKRARALEQVRKLSASLGLEPLSDVRIHGKRAPQKASTGLEELLESRRAVRQ